MQRSFPIALRDAIGRAAGFLIGRQCADGCWIDWALPPGRADAWTTAYVGCQLSCLPYRRRLRTLNATARAARWLVAHEWPEGGWGYNRAVGSDADSTAWAILLLSVEGLAVPSTAWDRLARFRRPDGGFSTYASDEGLQSWGHSHVDVTAVAAYAILLCRTAEGPACALRYLRTQQRPDGLWNSYWWLTPLYATAACLRFFIATGATTEDLAATRPGLERGIPANAFETALLLDAMLHVSDGGAAALSSSHAQDDLGVRTVVASLLDRQMPDGSWPSEPVLRVSDRDCATPWSRVNAGNLYADPDRLFTSATVLRSLACAEACLIEPERASHSLHHMAPARQVATDRTAPSISLSDRFGAS